MPSANRIRVRLLLAILAAAAAAAVPALRSDAQQLTIKLGTLAPDGSPWCDALKETGESWQKISQGRVKVNIYPGGVSGDEADMLRKMRIGQLHAAAITSNGLGGLVPDITAVAFPLTVATDSEMATVIAKTAPELSAGLAAKGFHVAAWLNAGWVHLFSKEPFTEPDEVKRRKIFIWGSDTLFLEFLKGSGFKPVPMTVAELLPGLQTGLVDFFAAPPPAALVMQWYPLAPWMSDMRWQPLPTAVLVANKQWEAIPAEFRPAFDSAAQAAMDKLQERLKALDSEAVSAMSQRGLKVVPMPPAAREKWVRIVHGDLYNTMVGKRFSKEFFARVQGILREARAASAATPPPAD